MESLIVTKLLADKSSTVMNFVEEEERKIKNILFDEDFQRREFHADLR